MTERDRREIWSLRGYQGCHGASRRTEARVDGVHSSVLVAGEAAGGTLGRRAVWVSEVMLQQVRGLAVSAVQRLGQAPAWTPSDARVAARARGRASRRANADAGGRGRRVLQAMDGSRFAYATARPGGRS